jgi:hypothetical protein
MTTYMLSDRNTPIHLLLSAFVLCTLLALAASPVQAQFHTEYHFTQHDPPNTGEFNIQVAPQALVDGAGSNSSSDTNMDLTMDCLAANGYGQWTMTSATNTNHTSTEPANGWFLLTNTLQVIHDGLTSTGSTIASSGQFSGAVPTEPKITANVDGRVRYVWPDPSTRNTFIVQGLNDQRGSTTSEKQIDISFPLPTIANAYGSLYPVNPSKPIFPYAAASVVGGGNTYTISNTASDFRDRFDGASDSNYLYITWRSEFAAQPGIYAMALDIRNNSVVLTPTFVGTGVQPTIACDVRNAPSSPDFYVAYLDAVGVGGHVKFAEYITGSGFSFSPVPNLYAPPAGGSAVTYAPLHARVLASSILGSSNVTTGIYVIIDGNGLILHRLVTAIAQYCDGTLMGAHASNTLIPSGGFSIIDEHLCAFSNPYDGQNFTTIGTFNQFHCLYRFVPREPRLKTPLLIIRGWDNGNSSTVDTRLTVSIIAGALVTTDKFVGAVNQTGIHVHWRNNATSTHYYSRDVRRFDEPIDENTLVTFRNVIGDGTSHGGTAGTRLLQGLRMSMWTDPNTKYYTQSADPHQNGSPQFNLMDDNTDLLIGNDGTAGLPAYFTTMPQCDVNMYCNINHPPDFDFVRDHNVIIKPNSVYDCRTSGKRTAFGISDIPQNPLASSEGAGAGHIQFQGLANNLAQVIVRPGANLSIGYYGDLTANYANIDFQYGNSITDPKLSGSSKITGKAYFIGTTAIYYSNLLGHIPGSDLSITNDSVGIINVEPCSPTGGSLFFDYCSSGYTQFDAHYSNFWNGTLNQNSAGSYNINFDGNGANLIRGIKLYQCAFGNVTVYGNDVSSTCDITNSSFDYMKDVGIHLKRTGNVTSYAQTTIQTNTFAGIGRLNSSNAMLSAILIEGYANTAANAETLVDVEDNTFATSSPPSGLDTAITFINTRAGAIHNTVSGGGYQVGVVSHGLYPIPTVLNSLICMNRISGGSSYGVYADHYQGFAKLNQISSQDRGYVSDLLDKGHVIFSYLHNCTGPGIDLIGASAILDLGGVHGANLSDGIDYAAFDTISGNGTSQIQMVNGASLNLAIDPLASWMWTKYCENNIIATGTSTPYIKSVGGTTLFSHIDQNYWGGGNPNLVLSTQFPGVSVTNTMTYRTTETNPGFSVSCGGGFATKKVDDIQPEANLDAAKLLTCPNWLYLGKSFQVTGQWKQSLDTLKYYIAHCANDTIAWQAFDYAATSNGSLDVNNLDRFRTFREWLKSVVFLNKWSDKYFCECVSAIANTYATYNEALAVVKFLIDSKRCSYQSLGSAYASSRQAQRGNYLTSGVDTNLVKLDTTLPSLDSLGLHLLTSGVASPPVVDFQLDHVRASGNPFRTSTEIVFNLRQTTYVRFEVYDQLGRMVIGDGTGLVYEPGSHKFTVSGRDLASGVYYARLSTPIGEVRTVKLTKVE